MKRNLNFIILGYFLLLCYGCYNSDDGIVFPSQSVNLLFPTNSLLCIDNTITFDWDDLGSSQNNNISYTIVIATNRNLTDIVENRTITMSEITLTLEKALAYYWKVTTTNATNNKKTSSETFSFYTQGEGIVNYAPFISELVSPSENSLVDQGSINLSWIGSDADPDDTLIYELSFSEIFPPAVIEESLSEETYTVLVESAKTYYWKVNTIDQDGAKSIGQVWSFTVN
ncbi:hypothetical protein N9750_00760 [Polaribacter sp.]|jgi:hypothetical protein|nr:hypothetical protein [Polaribacter sp.]MDG1245611.1 hypothetical protein [Polaribacter sp.]